MSKITFFCAVIAALCIVSCGGLPARRSLPAHGGIPAQRPESTAQAERVGPEITERLLPLPPEDIMGTGQIPQEKLIYFMLQKNPQLDPDFVENLTAYYIEEAAEEGVNYETAFAQMCLETGYLSYGGLVTPDMNNFCGLGATGPGQNGEIFPEPRIGVRAHIQHLKAYATAEPLNGELVDPRYRWVRYGSAPTIHGLAGTWAVDLQYGSKINKILEKLYDFSFE